MKKTKLLIVPLIIIVFSLSACTLFEKEEERQEKNPLIDQEREIESVASDFSFDVFQELANSQENLFISPYSLSTALTMAYVGSDGETREEMKTVLNLEYDDILELKKDVLHLKHHLETVSEEAEVSIANALFLKQGIPFLDSYIESGKNYFEAELDNLPQTGEPINQWVEEKTREKIDEIIDSGPIDPLVIAYLVNAIYFQADWNLEFDENLTRTRPFYFNNESFDVEMMENKDDYRYLVNDDIEAIKLDYSHEKYAFHAIMPNNLEDFYLDFNKNSFEDLKNSYRKDELTLRLPKFKMEEKFKLSDALEAMGMHLAFNPSQADFSKMVDLEELRDNVYISEVYHSTYIEVDETGTEAAAATAVEMSREMAVMDPLILEFNRPFIFLIEEKESNTILFMGQLVDPNNLK